MAISQHRDKRHIQTSIASYFDKEPSDSTPELDLETQSDLINVGMRVRKSVPEGYKTHKTIPPSRPSLSASKTSSQMNIQHFSSRELAPFSGIHKVGGLSQQDLTPAEHDMPFLTSSQETVSSTQSYEDIELRRKRSYEEEEDPMDEFFEEMEREDRLAARVIAQPKPFDRRRRMLDVLGQSQDFTEAHFLRPDDFRMESSYD